MLSGRPRRCFGFWSKASMRHSRLVKFKAENKWLRCPRELSWPWRVSCCKQHQPVTAWFDKDIDPPAYVPAGRMVLVAKPDSRSAHPGFFLLVLLLLLLELLGGGFGLSTTFCGSFGGRLSLLFFCPKAPAATTVATSIANRIRFSCFITALLLASFSPTH